MGNKKAQPSRSRPSAGEDGLYDYVARVEVDKEPLESPTTFNCMLSLPGTNYTKKRELLFYGKSFFSN